MDVLVSLQGLNKKLPHILTVVFMLNDNIVAVGGIATKSWVYLVLNKVLVLANLLTNY